MKKLSLFCLVILLMVYSCGKDPAKIEDPQPIDNESEVITSVKLLVKDSTSGALMGTFRFTDPDGDGGLNYTVFDTIRLKSNSSYLVDLVLLNEAAQPIDTISNEVLEEAKDHLVCFESTIDKIKVTRLDKDLNGLELGLKSSWITGAAGKGNLKVALQHQPGIKTGACGLGSTDVEVNFVLEIQ